jgi:hypothetical protein
MNWLRAIFVALLLIIPAIATEAQTGPPLFTPEQLAQHHCPSDTVVWVNLPSGSRLEELLLARRRIK